MEYWYNEGEDDCLIIEFDPTGYDEGVVVEVDITSTIDPVTDKRVSLTHAQFCEVEGALLVSLADGDFDEALSDAAECAYYDKGDYEYHCRKEA